MPFSIISLVWVFHWCQIVSVFILLETSLLFKDTCAGVEFYVSRFLGVLGRHLVVFGFPLLFLSSQLLVVPLEVIYMVFFWWLSNFKKYIYFIDYAITVVPFFSPLYSPSRCTPPSTIIPPTYFMFMGHTCKFFGFSISHTILRNPLSIWYLPFMLLFPLPFPPFSPLSLSADNPPCDLHSCDSVPILVVCLVCFSFCFFRFGCW